MINNKVSPFDRYIISINEAYAGAGSYKRKAFETDAYGYGVGGKGRASNEMSDQARYNEIRFKDIDSDIKNGKVFNFAELLADKFYKGKIQVAEKAILSAAGTLSTKNKKSRLNPQEYGLQPFQIPTFDLPNIINSIRVLKNIATDKKDIDFLGKAYALVGELYHKITGADPENVTELDEVRSFIKDYKNVLYKKYNPETGEESLEMRKQARPLVVGGKSQRDIDSGHTHIPNIEELKGANAQRLLQYAEKLFTADIRTIDTPKGMHTMPSSEESKISPASPETIGTPARVAEFKKRDVESRISSAEGSSRSSLKGQSTKLQKEIERSSQRFTPTPAKPKRKKRVQDVQESYERFIKVILF